MQFLVLDWDSICISVHVQTDGIQEWKIKLNLWNNSEDQHPSAHQHSPINTISVSWY